MPALEIASVGLDELRLKLVDDTLEARLARGDRDVAVDAAAAAAATPLREPTALLHVRALAADGRTAEAMSAAQSFRRRLVEETGLDPTEALAELEQQVAAGSVQRAPVVRRVAKPDSPMVGRQQDREEVVRLLGAHAVVTLTGPGGVGKTRLALDIAAGMPELGEAVVVPLAGVDRADRVDAAVAASLGLRVAGGAGPDQIAAGLADRELLLVLDNCEHVVPACRELVIALRRSAPRVRVLATSRVTLQVPGEYVVRLQPLPVPRDATDLTSLRRQSSVRAFIEHARRRRTGFELTDDDAPDLVEVLRRLDGLPLGIELAARQVAVMPLRAVRERLDRALDLSTGRQGPRMSGRRHCGRPSSRHTACSRQTSNGCSGRSLPTSAASTWRPSSCSLSRRPGTRSTSCTTWWTRRCWWRTRRARATGCSSPCAPSSSTRLTWARRGRGGARAVRRTVPGHRRGHRRADASPAEAVVNRQLRHEVDNLRSARDLAPADARVAITLAVNQVVTWRDLREIWGWAVELAEDPALAGHPERVTILAAAAEAARLVGDFDSAERRADEAIARPTRTTRSLR